MRCTHYVASDIHIILLNDIGVSFVPSIKAPLQPLQRSRFLDSITHQMRELIYRPKPMEVGHQTQVLWFHFVLNNIINSRDGHN